MMSLRASILVIEYGTADHLPSCLEALFASEIPSDHFEVIVLDNDSPTPIQPTTRARFPRVRWLEARENLGFAGGCAAAYAHARGEVIVSVNPDCMVRHDWLAATLGEFTADPRVGIVGGKLFHAQTSVLQHAGGRLFSNGRSEHVGEGELDAGQYDEIRDVDYVCGAAFAVRRQTIDDVGYLSTAYFPAYYEETELCVRAQAAGWRVIYTPRAVAQHAQAVASGGAGTQAYLERYHRGRARFLLRNRPNTLADTLLGEAVFLRAAPARERAVCARAWFGALRDAWTERPTREDLVRELTPVSELALHPLRGRTGATT